MADKKATVNCIVQFLRDEKNEAAASDDFKEGLEVAIQVLEDMYGLGALDANEKDILSVPKSLLTLVEECRASMKQKDPAAAEKMKEAGNQHMSQQRYQEALEAYTNAIKLDYSNPIYYCNRAAAHSSLGQHQDSVLDCKQAIAMNNKYTRAYLRLGCSLMSLGDHKEARVALTEALKLEPGNQSCQEQLQKCESALRQSSTGGAAQSGLPNFGTAGPGGMDFMSMLNNPNFISFAQNIMQSPQMQQLMTSIGSHPEDLMAGTQTPEVPSESQQPSGATLSSYMEAMAGITGQGGLMGGVQAPNVPESERGSSNSFNSFMQASQAFASQLQQNNPELYDNLMQQLEQAKKPPGQ